MRHRSKQAASHKSKVVLVRRLAAMAAGYTQVKIILVRRLAAMAAGCTSENYSCASSRRHGSRLHK
jgi:hypothetical protein